MSTRKPSFRNRALRPSAENLEQKHLLSAVVSGLDAEGDQWTLRLIGPGSLSVTKQDDSSGNPGSLDSLTNIDTITIGGLNPTTSRLVDHVVPAAGSTGQVYFQTLNELPSKAEHLSGGNGPLAIDIPDFWLANTTPSTSTTTPPAPSITIPDGVDTLRFGGVDTSFGQVTPAPATTAAVQYTVELGQPEYGGTRIIINRSISSAQVVPATSTSTTPTTVQDSVVFAVSGRLDLFQANSIDGNASTPPGQFSNFNAAATGFGGTWVVSGTPGVSGFETPFFTASNLQGSTTGQIGNIRIGNNATNFAALVFDGTGGGDGRMANFSVGGETNNVLVVAPNGMHNLEFGEGMDTVEVNAHVVNDIKANRGAVDSQIFVDRTISNVQIGGDVTDSYIVSGVQQDYTSIYDNITGQSTSIFEEGTPTAAPLPTNAQTGGGMTLLVAGNVTDSVFAASAEPGAETTNSAGATIPEYGSSGDLLLPTGHIRAKIEGAVNNPNATPDQPGQALYAKNVTHYTGPVVPPNVPEAPYTGHQPYIKLPGVVHPQKAGTFTTPSAAKSAKADAVEEETTT